MQVMGVVVGLCYWRSAFDPFAAIMAIMLGSKIAVFVHCWNHVAIERSAIGWHAPKFWVLQLHEERHACYWAMLGMPLIGKRLLEAFHMLGQLGYGGLLCGDIVYHGDNILRVE